jgi:hypothetical protein
MLKPGFAMVRRSGGKSEHCLLHRTRERWTGETYQPMVWSDEIDAWLVFDPGLVAAIFASDAIRVSLSADDIAAIETRLDLNLGPLRRATAAMPVAYEGETHAALRRAMAMRVRNHAEAALGSFSETFATGLAEPIHRRMTFDLSGVALAPAIARLMSAISGFDLQPTGDGLAPSQMLDRLLSLQRRKTINARIGDLMERAEKVAPDGQPDIMVAMAILGFDTLHATLSESLITVLRRHQDIRLDRIDWPDEIEETGVPFVERSATASVVIEGHEIRKGQKIRLILDDTGPDGVRSADLFFGKGRHACIGRAISQSAWASIVAQMRRHDCVLSVKRVAYRHPDYMFRFATEILVRADDVKH